jgi:hypothetical protein
MASSYNTIGLELMATGENAGTWGSKTNSNLNLVEQAIAGYEAVTITDSTTTTLVMSNAALSNARNMIIKIATITLTGATTVTIPNGIEKFYIFDLTAITGVTNLTIKTASGTGFTAGEAKIVAAYSDGTDLKEIALDTLGGTIGSAQIANNAILSAAISANQVTTAKIADNAITTAKISALQVTADKIANSTITAAKLATDSVGPDQLISTGVTAGSYTAASITVDADGRLTAASSGSAGSKPYLATDGAIVVGGTPASYTFTAQPTATNLALYLIGGGGGGSSSPGPNNPGPGGNGGFGYWSIPISPPYSQPFTVGGGGAGASGNGTAGGSTTFGSPVIATATGGSGGAAYGSSGQPGANGTAPGATIDFSVAVNPAVPTSDNDIAMVRKVGGLFGADQSTVKAPNFRAGNPAVYFPFGKVQAGNGGANGDGGIPQAGVPGVGGKIIIYENIGD